MGSNDTRDEDGGYGAGNLVGSSTSGVRSAIEARQSVYASRARGSDDARRADADVGRLADGTQRSTLGASPDDTAGAATLGDRNGGTRASAGRGDADRDSRDGGDPLRD